MLTKKQDGDHITVIPYCPHCTCHYRSPVVVHKLCFWFNNKIDHVVNEDSVKRFFTPGKTIWCHYLSGLPGAWLLCDQ
jgi:hypothetical protein